MTPLETRRKLGQLNFRKDALVSYRPIFPPSPLTVPEVCAKVNSAQFPFRFSSDELPQVFVEKVLSYKGGTRLFTK